MAMPEWMQWAGGAVTLFGGGAGFVAFIKARPEARKIDAEAAAQLGDSSVRIVQGLEEELTYLRNEVRAVKEKQESVEREQRRKEQQEYYRLRAHERWDNTIAQKLRDLGEDVTDPPPLYPDPATT